MYKHELNKEEKVKNLCLLPILSFSLFCERLILYEMQMVWIWCRNILKLAFIIHFSNDNRLMLTHFMKFVHFRLR